jgi:regulator of sigma E protease
MDFKTILEILYVIAAVIFLFGAAVFVHEFGHFWVARKCGMKVEAFAIGFGPKIISWVRDGIEYSWRWIPAGGFVKLPQMITSEAIEGGNKGEPLPPASPMSRILVAVAGPFMNIVFGFVIATVIYFVGLPVLVNPSIIGRVEPDSPEAKMGILPGDRIVKINDRRVRTWQDVAETTALGRTNVFDVVIERANQRKTYQLEAKASETIGLKILNLDPQEHPTVMGVLGGSAAEAAGVKPKDILYNFSGVPIWGSEQFVDLVQKRADQATPLIVLRGPAKEQVTLQVTPRPNPKTGKGFVGIEFGVANNYEVQKPGPLPWVQMSDHWNRTTAVFGALLHPKQTGVGPKDLSGPVGIFTMLAYYVKTDYRLALSFLVLLNVNLAILNMMPLPVLDGGHILMAIIEAIFRRPLPVRVQEYATTVFAVALLCFMAYVTFHDIGRISLFKTMFKQESQIDKAPAVAVPANTN